MTCTINNIISEIEGGCGLKSLYLKRIKKFFRYFDENNCNRTYIEIINYSNKKEFRNESINFFLCFIFIFTTLAKLFKKIVYI